MIKKTSETRPLGATVVNAYDNSQINAYSTEYANSAFGGTILWTNTSPTSNFAGQQINLNSSDYDMYEVIASISTTSDLCVSTGRIPKSKLGTLTLVGVTTSSPYYNFRQRSITAKTDTTITFADSLNAYGNTSVTSNGQMIPLYVIGYKTGLFS